LLVGWLIGLLVGWQNAMATNVAVLSEACTEAKKIVEYCGWLLWLLGVLGVSFEVRKKKQFTIEHKMYHSRTRCQHNDRRD